MLVSNCCGSEGRKEWFGSGMPYREFEICDKCGEHCEYVEEDTRDVDHALDLFGKLGEFFNPKTNQETLDKITQKIKK